MGVQKHHCTVAEYLKFENDAREKHEYRDGEILMMAGSSGDHSLVLTNLLAALHSRLRGGPCRVYESNLRIRIPRKVLYTYPDATVICGQRQADPDDPSGMTFTNPRLILEVLSPTTEGYDRGEKFNRYREIESLQEYVLVSQDTPRIETFYRQADGTWIFRFFTGLEALAILKSIEVELPLAEVYEGVEFDPAEGD